MISTSTNLQEKLGMEATEDSKLKSEGHKVSKRRSSASSIKDGRTSQRYGINGGAIV